MTMTASATAEVAATPREVLEFVLDLHRYQEVDTKIVRVVSVDGPDKAGHGCRRHLTFRTSYSTAGIG